MPDLFTVKDLTVPEKEEEKPKEEEE